MHEPLTSQVTWYFRATLTNVSRQHTCGVNLIHTSLSKKGMSIRIVEINPAIESDLRFYIGMPKSLAESEHLSEVEPDMIGEDAQAFTVDMNFNR